MHGGECRHEYTGSGAENCVHSGNTQNGEGGEGTLHNKRHVVQEPNPKRKGINGGVGAGGW